MSKPVGVNDAMYLIADCVDGSDTRAYCLTTEEPMVLIIPERDGTVKRFRIEIIEEEA